MTSMPSTTTSAPNNCLEKANRTPSVANSKMPSSQGNSFKATLREMQDAESCQNLADQNGKELPPGRYRSNSLGQRAKIVTTTDPTPTVDSLLALPAQKRIAEHLSLTPPSVVPPLALETAVPGIQVDSELMSDISNQSEDEKNRCSALTEAISNSESVIIACANGLLHNPIQPITSDFGNGNNFIASKTPGQFPKPGPDIPLEAMPSATSPSPLVVETIAPSTKPEKNNGLVMTAMEPSQLLGSPAMPGDETQLGQSLPRPAPQTGITLSPSLLDTTTDPIRIDAAQDILEINQFRGAPSAEINNQDVKTLGPSHIEGQPAAFLEKKTTNIEVRSISADITTGDSIDRANTVEPIISDNELFSEQHAPPKAPASNNNPLANPVSGNENPEKHPVDLTALAPPEKGSFHDSYFVRSERYHALSERLAELVAQRITAEIAKGSWQLDLRLNPVHLGKIDIKLTRRQNGSISAEFSARETNTRDLLVDGLPKFKELLAASGLDPEMFTVRPETPTPHGDGQSPPPPKNKTAPPHSSSNSELAQPARRDISIRSYIGENGLDITV